MPNGDSLLGNYSSTQSALIVAQPGSSRYFYVFTTDDFCNDHLIYGFRYSIVDICLNNGLGDVMKEKKNVKLLDTVAEKLTAVRHSNGTDYWVIVHKYFSDAFYSFNLTSAGITGSVVSHIGSIHPIGMIGVGGAIGQLKASPNGQKLAIVNGNAAPGSIAEYFDFDKTTGIISNSVSVQTNTNWNYYGVSFSPDNSKLYIACWLNGYGIYQFNLAAGGGNADSVIASKILITPNINRNYFGMQLANDGKIYISRRSGHPQTALSVINFPNNLGMNCNYVDSAIYLNGKISLDDLPNFIDSYDYSNKKYNCENGIEEITNANNAILYQNAPNPFGNGTIIKYFVPDNTDSEIIFFDEFGRQLKVFNIAEKGMGQLNIEATNLTPGMYSYSLWINGKIIDTKKMIKQ